MNKTEFIKNVRTNSDVKLSANDMETVVDAVFDTITNALAGGDSVKITGFGVFETRDRAARTGVDPRDPSKKIKIAATKSPAFRAGQSLKNAVKCG